MNEINPTAVPIKIGHQRKLDFKRLKKLTDELIKIGEQRRLAKEHNERFVTKYKKT